MRENEMKTADFLGVCAVAVIDMERDVIQAVADHVFSPVVSNAFVGMVEDLCGNAEVRRIPLAVVRLLKVAAAVEKAAQEWALEMKEGLAKSEVISEFCEMFKDVDKYDF